MLYIDINIRSGEPPIRLPVYKGDTADQLAKEFCIKHSINPEVEKQLVDIFSEKMRIIRSDRTRASMEAFEPIPEEQTP